MLKYGEETLEKMQDDTLNDLTTEYLGIGNEYDRTVEQARIRQTYAMQQLTEQ